MTQVQIFTLPTFLAMMASMKLLRPIHALFCILLVIIGESFNLTAHACPLRSGFVDVTCNKRIRVVFAGDSVVSGVGDTRFNNRGGYPKRVDMDFPRIQVVNLGVSGDTTSQVFAKVRSAQARRDIKGADFVVVDAGRNDCRDGISNSTTIKNLRGIVRYIRSLVRKNHRKPEVFIGTQIPSRVRHTGCIESLNDNLLENRSNQLPAFLRFDTLSSGVLSSDGLHPDSSGYEEIADFVVQYLRGAGAERALAKKPDQDGDGVFDIFEVEKFKTDPNVNDTDGDGVGDGEEIFTNGTDPLVVETNGIDDADADV